jgi:DNA mismatch repair protein MutS
MAEEKSLTPMMEQYFRVKEKHRDAILFFRLGDFYEMFYEDARVASPILEIALTSRQKVPMCGVPYHAVNAYLNKLLRLGYKVAICEQVEDPAAAKGVVRREVVKVLTPGTAVEVDNGDARENAYIAAVSVDRDGWGLALLDIAVGEVKAVQGPLEEERSLKDELFRSSPKEVVYPAGREEFLNRVMRANGLGHVPLTPVEAWRFEPLQAGDVLKSHFGVASLAGFGLEGRSLAVSAAGALLGYVKKVRQDSLKLVHRISYLHPGGRLVLDAATVRNLELVRNLRDGRVKDSLLEVMDFTVTSMGGRLLRSWVLQPLCDREAIERRLEAVAEALDRTVVRSELRESLRGIHDLERIAGKISLGAVNPRDLVSLRKSLERLPEIGRLLGSLESGLFRELAAGWDSAADVASLIERAVLEEPAVLLTEGGIIKDGFNPELDELRSVSRSGKTLIAGIEKRERERTGISSLKVRFNKVMGYYIEVTKPNLPQVPADYMRKQTLVGSERFLTPELKEYEEKVLHAEERTRELEYRLFLEVREAVAVETRRLQKTAAALALLDVLLALGELASRRGYARPEVHEGDSIHIEEGRHPVVEVSLAGEPFIPNDLDLDCDQNQILIITGPNMGGKSTYLRQAALITLMAQMGSFVPARSASIGLVDRVFTRIGAMDFLSVGQSTFMVEMLETANILHNATPRSLILLDEVGRGTSTFDGLSIAWAVAEYLHDRPGARPRTLFATHYHELTELAQTMPRIKNFHVSVKEWKEDVLFLRKIVPGPSDRSYGIHVAKLAGLPRPVIDRAREILLNLERLEFSESGPPRFAYRGRRDRDRNQPALFPENREADLLRDIADEIRALDPASISPLEALGLLDRIRKRLLESGGQ